MSNTDVPIKADAPGFHDPNYHEVRREEKDGWTIIHQENAAGRRRIVEKKHGELDNVIYPDGGCSIVNGSIFCSFQHINWQVSPRKETTELNKDAE